MNRSCQPEQPADWSELQWHRTPGPARYKSHASAERASRWLNANEHTSDRWLFRAGKREAGRWYLDRRWVG